MISEFHGELKGKEGHTKRNNEIKKLNIKMK